MVEKRFKLTLVQARKSRKQAVADLFQLIVSWANEHFHPAMLVEKSIRENRIWRTEDGTWLASCVVSYEAIPWAHPYLGVWDMVVIEADHPLATPESLEHSASKMLDGSSLPEDRVYFVWKMTSGLGGGNAIVGLLIHRFNLHGLLVGPCSVEMALRGTVRPDQFVRIGELAEMMSAMYAALDREYPNWRTMHPMTAATVFPVGDAAEIRGRIMDWAIEHKIGRDDPTSLMPAIG